MTKHIKIRSRTQMDMQEMRRLGEHSFDEDIVYDSKTHETNPTTIYENVHN